MAGLRMMMIPGTQLLHPLTVVDLQSLRHRWAARNVGTQQMAAPSVGFDLICGSSAVADTEWSVWNMSILIVLGVGSLTVLVKINASNETNNMFFHIFNVMKQLHHHPPSFCSSFETFGIDGKSLFKINSGPNSFIMVSAWQNRVGTICGSWRWHGISDTDHPLAVKNGLNNSKGFRIFQCTYSSLAINFVQWLDKWASKKLAFTANRSNQTETFGSIITSANYSQSESFWPGV